ncbi:hypothetical protein C8Q80DRAFT_1156994 [Daedaleopsis nitida]|nr:hypothetical protein C8Q80DRAFT_1156994 [Daedaleopsis nitida]
MPYATPFLLTTAAHGPWPLPLPASKHPLARRLAGISAPSLPIGRSPFEGGPPTFTDSHASAQPSPIRAPALPDHLCTYPPSTAPATGASWTAAGHSPRRPLPDLSSSPAISPSPRPSQHTPCSVRVSSTSCATSHFSYRRACPSHTHTYASDATKPSHPTLLLRYLSLRRSLLPSCPISPDLSPSSLLDIYFCGSAHHVHPFHYARPRAR